MERWLARKAPATYKKLARPATQRAIAKAEAAMGMRFPDDLRASLLRHDGGGSWGFGPAPFYELMSAKYIHSDWKMLCGIVLDGASGELDTSWWDGHLIPFAAAHDGGNLFIDSRTGKTGDYFNETGLTYEGDVVWPSYLALLKATARSLETGKPIRGWRPAVDKGELNWDQAF
ncbi:SMI1/KNR4 family protein [Acrocarpospora macrocephala]|nr:SMI1/KNR4 family protein [Acrocarpospora macrocephala]